VLRYTLVLSDIASRIVGNPYYLSHSGKNGVTAVVVAT
jgi:hypothetical protein